MSALTRRRLLATLGAASAAAGLPVPARAAPIVRHDVASSEGKAMLKIYALGVSRMMSLPEANPRGWQFQWYTHAIRTDRTKAGEIKRIYGVAASPEARLAQAVWNTCKSHFGEPETFFLPWHRMFVAQFEATIRTLTGRADFTLPYWDYTDPAKTALPPEFRMAGDPVFGALFRPHRNDGVNAGKPIDKLPGASPLSNNCLRSLTYADNGRDAGLCANLDNNPHGALHVNVGNEQGMGEVPWAARDPIFWVHHCNIDRLWASWNKAGGLNPANSAFLNTSFTFADGFGKATNMAIREVMETTAPRLNYVYDAYVPRPAHSRPFAHPLVASRDILAAAPGVRLSPDNAHTSLPLAPPPPAALEAERPLFLRLENIVAASQPGVSYDVFLNPATDRPTRDDPSFVGTLNFFGATPHHAEGHDMAAAGAELKAVSFDVTEKAAKLAAEPGAAPPHVVFRAAGTAAQGSNPTVGNVALVFG